MVLELKKVQLELKTFISLLQHVYALRPISNAQTFIMVHVYHLEAYKEPLQRTHVLIQGLFQGS